MSTNSSPSPTPAAQRTTAVTGGFPPKLEGTATEERARTYAAWLVHFGATGFGSRSLPDAPDDLARFARHYGTAQDGLVALTPDGGRQTRKAIRTTAKKVRTGQKALKQRRYMDAERAFDDATDALRKTRDLLRRDFRSIEAMTGRRITRNGFVSDSTTTTVVTVNAWVDGDTVDTSNGRIRLIGINTPELQTHCDPARAAKAAAEQLAPAGQRIRLTNPTAVRDKDRYGRLLRYVDVVTSQDSSPVDVGFSLLLNELAEARYDSRDGYQWHPRENSYRAIHSRLDAGDRCPKLNGSRAFTPVRQLADVHSSPEYWRRRILVRLVAHPYASSRAHLSSRIVSVRRANARADRPKKRAPTTPSRKPSPGFVHPGAFCSPLGKTGFTSRGTLMICQVASDGRHRWKSS